MGREVRRPRREDALDAVHGGGAVRRAEALAREHVREVGRVRGHVEEDAIPGLDAVAVPEVPRGGGDGAEELAPGDAEPGAVHARLWVLLLGQRGQGAVVAAAVEDVPVDRVERCVGLGAREPSKVGRLGAVHELVPGRPASAIPRGRRDLDPGTGRDRLVPGAPRPRARARGDDALRLAGCPSSVYGAVRAIRGVPPPHRLRRARRGVQRALMGREAVAGGGRDDHVWVTVGEIGAQHLPRLAPLMIFDCAVRTKGPDCSLRNRFPEFLTVNPSAPFSGSEAAPDHSWMSLLARTSRAAFSFLGSSQGTRTLRLASTATPPRGHHLRPPRATSRRATARAPPPRPRSRRAQCPLAMTKRRRTSPPRPA